MAKRKPGKYAGVIDGLEILPTENPTYQAKIDKHKELLRAKFPTVEGVAAEYTVYRAAKDDIKEQLSIIQEQLTALEQLLAESQDKEESGWGDFGMPENNLRLRSGVTIAVETLPIGKVVDKEKFRQWCIAEGLETSLQLWPTTMNSIVKERLVSGQPNPDGVKVYQQKTIKARGLNGSED